MWMTMGSTTPPAPLTEVICLFTFVFQVIHLQGRKKGTPMKFVQEQELTKKMVDRRVSSDDDIRQETDEVSWSPSSSG